MIKKEKKDSVNAESYNQQCVISASYVVSAESIIIEEAAVSAA